MSRTAWTILCATVWLAVIIIASFIGLSLHARYAADALQRSVLLSSEEEARTGVASSTAPMPLPHGGVTVPILVYHIVRPAYASDSAAVKALAVTPELFSEELETLKNNGYSVIPFSSLIAYLYQGTPLPPHPVIITLDDGWEDQYLYAFPILEQFKYSATFFVPTNFPDHKGFFTWDQLRTMQAAGMDIESHSESHPYLTDITSTTTLWNEIDGSKLKMQEELGTTTTIFDYPFGAYNGEIVTMVKEAGYKAARADYYGLVQSKSDLYDLGVLTAPTTLSSFEKYFPQV